MFEKISKEEEDAKQRLYDSGKQKEINELDTLIKGLDFLKSTCPGLFAKSKIDVQAI
jgi:hypothetical protein